ncbi:alpha-mannosidase 2-like [Teleopsis dalmanni]|uniref:alpha-mannosidase 2-like n=2 Tax=Teleopsis dalmanni TaxID=139649 RepID=UPI0018CDBBF4|nr:alpha-mannosidase 2-like [Teleopsis dalmanni]
MWYYSCISVLIFFCLYFVMYNELFYNTDEDQVLLLKACSHKLQQNEDRYEDDFEGLFSKSRGRDLHNVLIDNENYTENCCFNFEKPPKTYIQLLDFYKNLSFPKDERFLWDKGWNIQYDPQRFNEKNKLEVFVVPHSHNDPGWLRTFNDYYHHKTKPLLENIIQNLFTFPDLKFIWAEICYFSRFYDTQDLITKERIKKLVHNGQLEFVTGGWGMPDEANTHWISLLIQLTEGQSWLKQNFNITPINSWSIDPFGHSPTLPYILKQSGFQNLLIQRTHYSVKYNLGNKRLLEFLWRQLWDTKGDTELFTHMMPFLSYGMKHTCGPDRTICEQFDFRYINKNTIDRFFRRGQDEITTKNIVKKSNLLVDQWKKKAELYRTNALLVPLGDDFRYQEKNELLNQRNNYERLFYYINRQTKFNVNVRFATLQEYFEAVHKHTNYKFPTLSGDFFTYADREDDYWSGYYTTRPFYKRMERVLLYYLRAAEQLNAWNVKYKNDRFEKILRNVRRQLSLFQHHDGITGTARAHVVEDYSIRLKNAIKDCQYVMEMNIFRLMTRNSYEKMDYNKKYFDIDDSNWPCNGSIRSPIIFSEEDGNSKFLVFHNSLAQWREETVQFLVTAPFILVSDLDGRPIQAQITPVVIWDKITPTFLTKLYNLHFVVKIPPLGMKTYILNLKSEKTKSKHTYFASNIISNTSFIAVNIENYPKELIKFTAQREYIITLTNGGTIHFNNNGTLKSIKTDRIREPWPVSVQFYEYGTNWWSKQSGAYLFLPNGPGKPLVGNFVPYIVYTEGPIESSVCVGLPLVVHCTRIYDNKIEIRNIVNISPLNNFEISMRIATTIKNKDVFYTDLNGLQMIKRNYFHKLPLQANFYPVPTAAYIEDENTRLTIITAQPLGGTSLSSGVLEIMLDRRLSQSDGRGLGEGVLDNQPTEQIFHLLFENLEGCEKRVENHPAGALTLAAYRATKELLNPISKFVYVSLETALRKDFGTKYSPISDDMEIITLRNIINLERNSTEVNTGVIIHRTKVLECSAHTGNLNKSVQLHNLFPFQTYGSSIHRTTLTFLKNLGEVDIEELQFCPMDTKALIFKHIPFKI